MSPRTDTTENRRNQILSNAEEVFNRKGFDETRMDDIAERAGLSKGTLYLYFKSKDDLIIAILDRIFSTFIEQLKSRKQGGQVGDLSAEEEIRSYTEAAIHDYQAMMRLMPVAYEFLALAFRNKLVQQVLHEYFKAYLATMVPIIEKGITNREFRDVNAAEVAIAIAAIYEGTVLLMVYDPDRVELDRHIRSGVELVISGIRLRDW